MKQINPIRFAEYSDKYPSFWHELENAEINNEQYGFGIIIEVEHDCESIPIIYSLFENYKNIKVLSVDDFKSGFVDYIKVTDGKYNQMCIKSELLSKIESVRDSCENNCGANCHNILYEIIKKYPNYYCPVYTGGLFAEYNNGGEYPVFNGKHCIQYLQEYVPFHIPQIKFALENTIINDPDVFPKQDIYILDVCSGPATVPLVFCKMFSDKPLRRNLKFTTIEASDEFNNMIDIFKNTNTNASIEITEKIHCTFQEFIKNSIQFRGKFDWIIMANCISCIGNLIDTEEVNHSLNKMLTNLLNGKKTMILTIIETGNYNLKKCIENLSFNDVNIIKVLFQCMRKQLDEPWLQNCKFYNTGYAKYQPYVTAKSLLLELK